MRRDETTRLIEFTRGYCQRVRRHGFSSCETAQKMSRTVDTESRWNVAKETRAYPQTRFIHGLAVLPI